MFRLVILEWIIQNFYLFVFLIEFIEKVKHFFGRKKKKKRGHPRATPSTAFQTTVPQPPANPTTAPVSASNVTTAHPPILEPAITTVHPTQAHSTTPTPTATTTPKPEPTAPPATEHSTPKPEATTSPKTELGDDTNIKHLFPGSCCKSFLCGYENDL